MTNVSFQDAASCLGLLSSDVEEVEGDGCSHRDKIVKLLTKWKTKMQQNCCKEELVKCLQSLKRPDVVRKVADFLLGRPGLFCPGVM